MTVGTVVLAGVAAGLSSAIRAYARNFSICRCRALARPTEQTFVELTLTSDELTGAAANLRPIRGLKASPAVFTEALTFTVLAHVSQVVWWTAAGRLVADVNCAVATVEAVILTSLTITCGSSETLLASAGWSACMRGRARSSILTVVPAVVDLTSLAGVAGLTATLGHLSGIQEAATTVQTLDVTWTSGRRERRLSWTGSLNTRPVICHVVIGTSAHWSTGAQQTQPLTFLAVTWVCHFWLLVAMIQDDVSSVVYARGEVLHRAFSKLVDPEHKVIDVRHPIDIVLKYVNAEGMKKVVFNSRYGSNRV